MNVLSFLACVTMEFVVTLLEVLPVSVQKALLWTQHNETVSVSNDLYKLTRDASRSFL